MPSIVAVTDTHALLWHATGRHRKLGRHARDHFTRADEGAAVVYVPILVLAELGELQHLGHIRLGAPFGNWVDALTTSGKYVVADLTEAIIRRANDLFEIRERGDRLIAATALALDMPLMTCDANIAACARVERLWD